MFMGDFHIGHEQFAEGHLKKYLRLLKDHPNIMMVGMGDYLEAFINLQEDLNDSFYSIGEDIITLFERQIRILRMIDRFLKRIKKLDIDNTSATTNSGQNGSRQIISLIFNCIS